MATIELAMNDAIAGVLRQLQRAWSPASVVRSEHTGVLLKSPGKRPDILIMELDLPRFRGRVRIWVYAA